MLGNKEKFKGVLGNVEEDKTQFHPSLRHFVTDKVFTFLISTEVFLKLLIIAFLFR